MGNAVATVAELWRYPAKGMRGERLHALDLDAHGVAGDRRFAVESSGAPRGKPMLSGAERAAMLLYAARLQDGLTVVATPRGAEFHIDDPALLNDMHEYLPGGHALSLVRSATPQTDVRPVALLGTRTVPQLAREFGRTVDARRFRANLLLEMAQGFAEDGLVGHELCIGDAVLRVTERTPRCRVVTLDPDTAVPEPALMKHLDRAHGGCVGIYAVVVSPGPVRVGDPVFLL